MTTSELKRRTQLLAKNVAVFCQQLPPRDAFRAYSKQLYRSSSSVGANYRAACRAKSNSDFINKLKLVEEECDETMFFIELIVMLEPRLESSAKPILKEADEILAIMVSSIRTLRKNRVNCKSSQS